MLLLKNKMKRNICILTQPLLTNYGCLLQAFALQKVLKDMGNEVVTDKRPIKLTSFCIKFLSVCKRIVYKFILLKKSNILFPYFLNKTDYNIISKNTESFILNNIATIDLLGDHRKISSNKTSLFDTYIVGSDQVWRPRYSRRLSNYFFDFIANDMSKKKIAYAASFGVDSWEFSYFQTKNTKKLASLFDAISVREDSAVNLCDQYLDVKATQVLDPTLLLDKEDYLSLIKNDHIPQSKGNLMTYVLDQSLEKNEIIEKVAKYLSLLPFKVMPELKLSKENRKNIDKCVYPKVTEWLRGFMDAKFVVTDSFHGTVFSIIFNKPFIAIANKGRGVTRFTSLLKIFGLEDRLIYSMNELTEELINKPIDFNHVNMIREEQKTKSIQFLVNALK